MATKTTTKQLHPIFADCCDDDHSSLPPSPFIKGDYVYATDSRICVRCPRAGITVETPPGDKPYPPVEQLAWARPASEPVELPDVGNGMVTCESCNGTRRIDMEEFGVEQECPDCDGTGCYRDFTGETVGPLILGRGFIAILCRNGVSHVYPIQMKQACRNAKTLPAAWFTADDFEGVLMGMKAK